MTFPNANPTTTAGIVPRTISAAIHAARSGFGPRIVPRRGTARSMARMSDQK